MSSVVQLLITEFTDPACPFAWSAEPTRRRLQWLYGEDLEWKLCMVGPALDDPATPAQAARDVDIDPDELAGWMAELALQEDLEAAPRRPSPATLALDHKLAGPVGERRYTCPSYEFLCTSDGMHISVPGFQPLSAYEVAIANLAPHAARRSDPAGIREVLAWANEPLATIEVATICATDLSSARQELGRVAHEEHLGFDGLWSLAA